MGLGPGLDTCIRQQTPLLLCPLNGMYSCCPVCSVIHVEEPSALTSFLNYTLHKNSEHYDETPVIKSHKKNLYYYKIVYFLENNHSWYDWIKKQIVYAIVEPVTKNNLGLFWECLSILVVSFCKNTGSNVKWFSLLIMVR